jgi:hypothetical protein
MQLQIVKLLVFALTVSKINLNIKWKVQQKKLETIRGSYTGLDLSIHAKKGTKKSLETLPLNEALVGIITTSGTN